MADFGIRFFLCNLFICPIMVMLLVAKRLLRNCLTNGMQFHLWYLVPVWLAVPFLPFRFIGLLPFFSWLGSLKQIKSPGMGSVLKTAPETASSNTLAQVDFALSVSNKIPSMVGLILVGIWLTGILAMVILAIKSHKRLKVLKDSSLPLQNKEIRLLYNSCLNELKIKKEIPIYSAAFLKSPIIAGLFHPCIYFPIHLISDFHGTNTPCAQPLSSGPLSRQAPGLGQIRYMLLHELQHYKHKDVFVNYLMNLACILYWFNPFIWYAFREMQNDREVACDTSVLLLLEEKDYEDYGNTLINLAEKISFMPFSFAAGASGSMKQMKRRIMNISTYKKPSVWRKLKGCAAFCCIAALLFGLTPMLSTYAAGQDYYKWNVSSEHITIWDLSPYFGNYEGSFVLYDLKNETWGVYNMNHATSRTSPDSTYKIYDGLFGLEEGIITPQSSSIAWNGTQYPFEAWNGDQNLHSAMLSSVNWYFQAVDKQLGKASIAYYLKKIRYGNENITADLSSYWLQSSLKISPVEQVERLTDLYSNKFGFTPENVDAIKDSICLFSSDNKSFYGKTGTGRVDGQDVNGWFIGYVEVHNNTYFFATNIQSSSNSAGSNAAEITKAILADLDIWQ